MIRPKFLTTLSIKTRLIVAVSFLLISIIMGSSYVGLKYFEAQTKEQIATHQFLLVSLLANEIDDKLLIAHQDLISLSKLLTPEHLRDPDRGQEFLNRYEFMQSTFSNALVLFDQTGTLVAETPFQSKERRGKNFAFREYVATTIASQKPHVGDPYLSSRKHQHPVITLTAPIFDLQGELIGVLGGSIDLMADNVLSRLTSIKIGKTGYFFLFSSDRNLILHPDPSRILKQDIPEGSNLLLERAIKGFEGTAETVNSRGLHAITSFTHLKTKDWIIGANSPKEEAYAPINQARQTLIGALGAMIVLVTIAIWYLTNWLTRPLRAFTNHVAEIFVKEGAARFLPVSSLDEIGKLTQAFNAMVTDLDTQREALQLSEQKYRQIVDTSDEGIWLVNENDIATFTNIRWAKMLGYRMEEILGQRIDFLIYSEDHVDYQQKMGALRQGITEQYEWRWRHKDGREVWTIVSATSIFDADHHFRGSFAMVTDITARKQIEEALRASEDDLKEAQHIAKLGNWRLNIKSNQVAWSDEVYKMYGFDPTSPPPPYTEHMKLFTPESWERLSTALQHTRDTGIPYDLELETLRIDGSHGWIWAHGMAEVAATKEIVGLRGVAQDITDRKQSEEALRESEHSFRTLSNSGMALIWTSGTDKLCNYFNSVWLEFTGRTLEEEMGNGWTEGVHPDDFQRCLDIYVGAFDQQEKFSMEYRLRRHDGEYRWIVDEGCPRYDSHGNFIGYIGHCLDITERKLAEMNYQTLFNEMFDGFALHEIIVDDNGVPINYRFLAVNPAFERITGLKAADIIGHTVFDIMPDTEMRWIETYGKVALTGDPVHLEDYSTILQKHFEVTAYRPAPGQFACVIIDVTEKKNAAEEKQKLQVQLQQAQKMEAIGALAGGIAHDFNNILGAILGYAEMVQEDSPAGSRSRGDIDQVVKASHRAKELVKQILNFSRQAVTEQIPLHPALIIKEVVKMLRSSLPSTIDLQQDINPDVGLILADPTQIHQVLVNLCTNAFHAMEATGGILTISLKKTTLTKEDITSEPQVQPGDFVQLSISDTGSGIAPEIQEKMFDPFFTTKEVGKGTGMGLAIIHGIAKSYNGFITCHSKPGEGTVFHVYLPAIADPALLEVETVPLDLPLLGNERVLLVDDEEILADLGQTMLERLGYRVTVRRNSIEALNTFQREPDNFDLVITDQTMPGMTGSDLARRMLQIRPGMPIILCTGYSSVMSEEKACSLGIKGFAFKPLAKNDLAVLIRKVLDGEKPTG